ncbi:methyltransferase domain-containing protein [Pelagibius marinus]|uniref:methyltransferase domain-containing protein n=1 Tax=Pelagibius marinus TaxID=2762760 RepID=UPI001872A89D|nr:methyltransferase domain-containing protein [Pelagibius marinus]
MSDSLSNASPEIFDRASLRRHRERAAAAIGEHDFLIREVAERLLDRLQDIRRRFPLALDLGCHHGVVAELLAGYPAGLGGIETLVQADLSPAMARLAAARAPSLVADEEALPFAEGSLDLVLSVLSLHWVNDLPGTLLQIARMLKPDGLFLAAMIGGESLKELRAALMQAESEVEGGVSPRVSPFADLRDLGGLLQRAGFALPVADMDSITVTYPTALKLMGDLRGMGESGADRNRRRGFSRRETLLRAAALYQERHADSEGRIPATFEILYLTGWTPHASQQRPLAPGSAQARLAEALDSAELPSGDKADPKR